MNQQELRIGNYLQYLNGETFQVVCHDFALIRDIPEHLKPKPIILTSEWLERFGFNYNDLNGDSGHWQKPHFEIIEGEEDGFSYDYKLIVKYVHQLQNLYFALTGEELQIKMTPLEKLQLIKEKLSPAKDIMKELYAEYGITFMITKKDGFPEGELGMIIPLDRLEEIK